MVEAKLGIGATTPDAAGKVLKATAPGTTSWDYHTLVKLAEVSGTGSSGILTFSAIPATFGELLVTVWGRSSAAVAASTLMLSLNGNTTPADYDYQYMRAAGTALEGAESVGAAAFIFCGFMPGASSTASLHSAAKIWLPEYANTGAFKTVIAHAAGQSNLVAGGLYVWQASGTFESTAAISSVTLTLGTGNWTTASRARLYGVPA